MFLLAGTPAERGMEWHLTKLWVSALLVMRGTWQRSRRGRVVLCLLWESAIFDKGTNPMLMVNFEVGNFQPEFSAVLPFLL